MSHRCLRAPNTLHSVYWSLLQKGNELWVPKEGYQEHSGNTLLMNISLLTFYSSPSGNLCLSQGSTAHLINVTNLVTLSLSVPLSKKIWKYRELKHKCHFQRFLSILRHPLWAGARDRQLDYIIHLRNPSPKSTWWMPSLCTEFSLEMGAPEYLSFCRIRLKCNRIVNSNINFN